MINYMCSVLSGTGEGEVEEAEKLLKPFRLHYPRVSVDKDHLFVALSNSTKCYCVLFSCKCGLRFQKDSYSLSLTKDFSVKEVFTKTYF